MAYQFGILSLKKSNNVKARMIKNIIDQFFQFGSYFFLNSFDIITIAIRKTNKVKKIIYKFSKFSQTLRFCLKNFAIFSKANIPNDNHIDKPIVQPLILLLINKIPDTIKSKALIKIGKLFLKILYNDKSDQLKLLPFKEYFIIT